MQDCLDKISFLVGDKNRLEAMRQAKPWEPFDERMLDFFDAVSKKLMRDKDARAYPDVVTFAFWVRRASLLKQRERFSDEKKYKGLRLGKGIVFHIAPSNVAVNYAYSMAAGLLAGNANIVRVSSKEFPQVERINQAVLEALDEMEDEEALRARICVVRYEHSSEINDRLSLMADVRVVWGGDRTIEQLRKSPLGPRSTEVTFADRFSIAVIHADQYLESGQADRVAEDFYNDTYLTDQNACTSPRLVVWLGEKKQEAKQLFWERLYDKAKGSYAFQDIQGVNKLTDAYRCAANFEKVQVVFEKDSLLVRVRIPEIYSDLMEYKGNSGFFFEYDCDDILDLKALCDDKHCQTLSYFGEKSMLQPLVFSGIHGVDRIVPIGQTMDFDFIWDGEDLLERLTRYVCIL